ncbi:MAG: glutamine--fructose-6-phosphate transaminase (isomerizing) [bacterium]|nr:glutamine--fructose-6-phosphate transaminase (isomerizing) [bacterium]
MCGIIGYIGKQQAKSILMDGLRKMEYRGYDSAGIVVIDANGPTCIKKQGKIVMLESAIGSEPLTGTLGIAHTRWATHGIPSDENAHPHADCSGNFFVVHNGIIENAGLLRKELTAKGHTFLSETDTEVISHLIEEGYEATKNFEGAVRHAISHIIGAYGIAAVSSKDPNTLIAARLGSPLVIGNVGQGEYIVASDVAAILRHTREVIYIQDHEVAILDREGYRIITQSDQEICRLAEHVEWEADAAEKQGFEHFLLKEIFEQPDALGNAIRGRMDIKAGDAHLGGIRDVADKLSKIRRLVIVGCGAALYAGRVGEYMIEEYAGIPVELELASEFRYRKPVLDDTTAVLFISQSGETADTLAALKEVKRKGVLTLGIVNVVGSSVARETDAGIYIHAGPEISVTTTKAFMNQMAILALLAVFLGRQRDMSFTMGQRILEELSLIPDKIRTILSQTERIKEIAEQFKNATNALYLGRKYNLPIALEAALKLKEISYVHAEGYGAGEMKHGPIALIDEHFPVVAIVPQDSVYEKNLSNLEEVKARKGKIFAIATEGDEEVARLSDAVAYIPKTLEMLTPLLSVVPLQLFAYYSAIVRGRDVDQPRNLAKSVTVE